MSGRTVSLKVMGYTFGRTAISMKESGSARLSMVTVLISLQMGTFTKANIGMGNLMVSVNTSGVMVVFTLGTLQMATSMVRVNGGRITYLIATVTKAIIN